MNKNNNRRKLIVDIEKSFESSKHRTIDDNLYRARERLANIYEKKFLESSGKD